MSELSKKEDLDWENMNDLVPMNLIDSDFPESLPEILPQEAVESLLAPMPDAEPLPKPIPTASDTDNFTRLRAEVEAQNLAETADIANQEAKQEADEEAQRLRLEQWMANARARLEKADEEPTAPGRPPRVRREPSPTMVRRVEMQRTLFDPAAGFEEASGYRTGKIALDNADPLATIIVHRDAFVESTTDPKTGKLEAVQRRVAQIKQAESGAETMIITRTVEKPKRVNVKLAIWVMASLIPIILGLGVFALLQTGHLDSVSDLMPVASQPPSAPAASPPEIAKAAPNPEPVSAPTPPPAPVSAPATIPAPAPVIGKPKPQKPVLVKASIPRTPVSMVQNSPTELPAMSAPIDLNANSLIKALANAEFSVAGVEVAKPTDRNETATSALGEANLKAIIKAKLRSDARAMQGIYELFLKDTPGLNGDIVIGINVDPNGQISEGSVAASTTGSSELDQAILRKVLGWVLQEFPGNRPRYVAIPFHFEPPSP